MKAQRSHLLAAALFTATALVFGYTLVRALSVPKPAPAVEAPSADPARAAAATSTPAAPEKSAEDNGALSSADLALAVDRDPFRPERERVPERYRLPGEEVEIIEEPPPPPPPPPPPFRVVGTIVTPAGGVALIEAQQNVSRVVGIGEELFGYRLTAVNQSTATVEGNGRQYSMEISPPSPRGRAGNATGRATGAAGRGNARTPQEAAREQADQRATEVRERVQQQMLEMVERMRATGNSAEAERLLEQIRQGLPPGLGNVEVSRGANGQPQLIIRPRGDTTTVRRNQNP